MIKRIKEKLEIWYAMFCLWRACRKTILTEEQQKILEQESVFDDN